MDCAVLRGCMRHGTEASEPQSAYRVSVANVVAANVLVLEVVVAGEQRAFGVCHQGGREGGRGAHTVRGAPSVEPR